MRVYVVLSFLGYCFHFIKYTKLRITKKGASFDAPFFWFYRLLYRHYFFFFQGNSVFYFFGIVIYHFLYLNFGIFSHVFAQTIRF